MLDSAAAKELGIKKKLYSDESVKIVDRTASVVNDEATSSLFPITVWLKGSTDVLRIRPMRQHGPRYHNGRLAGT